MKIRAFTLSEVLISLAIVGVISALVIPTLKTNYQKKIYVAKLQKAIHVLNNGFKLMRVEEGVRFLSRTNMIECADDIFASGLTNEQRECINSNMQKYFGIAKHSKISDSNDYYNHSVMKYLNGQSCNDGKIYENVFTAYYSFYTKDNILFAPFVNSDRVYVDVNGKDEPNRFGRDIFILSIDDIGEVAPICLNGEWKQSETVCKCDDALSGIGLGCAARIKEEGWKMNY